MRTAHAHAHWLSHDHSLFPDISTWPAHKRHRLRKMDFHLVLLLLGTLAFHAALSDIPEHMVKSLPGWDAPLPTTQYSGYIQVDATKYLHYWWVVELRLWLKNCEIFPSKIVCYHLCLYYALISLHAIEILCCALYRFVESANNPKTDPVVLWLVRCALMLCVCMHSHGVWHACYLFLI